MARGGPAVCSAGLQLLHRGRGGRVVACIMPKAAKRWNMFFIHTARMKLGRDVDLGAYAEVAHCVFGAQSLESQAAAQTGQPGSVHLS